MIKYLHGDKIDLLNYLRFEKYILYDNPNDLVSLGQLNFENFNNNEIRVCLFEKAKFAQNSTKYFDGFILCEEAFNTINNEKSTLCNSKFLLNYIIKKFNIKYDLYIYNTLIKLESYEMMNILEIYLLTNDWSYFDSIYEKIDDIKYYRSIYYQLKNWPKYKNNDELGIYKPDLSIFIKNLIIKAELTFLKTGLSIQPYIQLLILLCKNKW